jgi:3-hydroxybutyryl-CoA dehydratase
MPTTDMYYLDDLTIGQQVPTAGRTITEADIIGFSGLSGDFHPMHIDEEWAREHHAFGGRVAQGMLIASITYPLRASVIDNIDLVGWMEELRRFRAPVRAGDTVRALWTVEEVRESASRPGTGIVRLGITVTNQRGDTVQDGYDILMVNKRPTADVASGDV